jgi:two-component system, OmpR family, response regulator
VSLEDDVMARAATSPILTAESGLTRYLEEIRRLPMLEPREEFMLAKRWRERGDREAAHRLVTSHLRLVAKFAMEHRGYGLPIAEVISEGNLRLMKAVRRFEPEKGFRLATYAMWWIRASIQEYVLRSWSLDGRESIGGFAEHLQRTHCRAPPSALTRAARPASQGRQLMENPMSSVQNGWQDDFQVDREAGGRRMSAVETVGDEAVSAAMTGRNESMARVLLIEDDKETADEIRAELGDRGFDVDWAANGIEGLDKARSGQAEAMIVDRLLPGMDGLTIIEALRYEGRRTPVLVLSALGAVDDRVRGLRAGGDDYLTKPFATVELIARLEALLRRPAESRDTALRVGPLQLDLIERTAKRGDRTIDLLPREFRLLKYMMSRKEQMLTRAMLLEEVWDYKFVPQTNLVDVHMGRLRRKVDEPHEPPMIHNVRGMGFILRAPA